MPRGGASAAEMRSLRRGASSSAPGPLRELYSVHVLRPAVERNRKGVEVGRASMTSREKEQKHLPRPELHPGQRTPGGPAAARHGDGWHFSVATLERNESQLSQRSSEGSGGLTGFYGPGYLDNLLTHACCRVSAQ